MIRNILSLYLLDMLLFSVVSLDITYHINEENSPHAYIGDIAADSNMSHFFKHQQHNLVTFTQLQRKVSSGSHLFNVTNLGKLYTTQTLDAESLCTINKECFKIVRIAVRKRKTYVKILKVKVIIKDINDHGPEFPESEINLQFDENDREGTKKPIPNAIDRDITIQNSRITYELKENIDDPFSLSLSKDYDGTFIPEIVLQGKLDRERKKHYMLKLIAKDNGIPPNENILHFQISVTDSNDNKPLFSQKVYNISIKNKHPKSKPILVLEATDLDSGTNGKIAFNYSPKTPIEIRKYFDLKKASGELFVNEYFKIDTKNSYKLFVEAKDGGKPPLSSTTVILISKESNHNIAPKIDIDFVFPLSESSTALLEDIKVSSFIAYVIITDNDIEENGQIDCNLEHETFGIVEMGSHEYKMTTKCPLDRETKDRYDIVLVCQDMGFPPLKSEKQFSIEVLDVNDVEPHFTKETFQFLTYENQKVDFPIGFINATDPDLGDGGQLTYSIINDNNNDNIPFQLTKYGFFSTSQSIDREMKDIYKFKVLVKDKGTPSLNDTANIVIEILDKNDNAPYFTFPNNDPYNLDVHYHPNSKKDITILKASDKDTGNNAFLTYGILKSNDKNMLTVNSYTGVLSFSRIININDAGTYELQFMVKDSGTPVQSATTVIMLTLHVSNDTLPMQAATHLLSGTDLNIIWVIIIVAAGVILSVGIVVCLTMCVFRCINHIKSSPSTSDNHKILTGSKMRPMPYETNNPIAFTRNTEDTYNRNCQTMSSKSHYYPEMEKTINEGKFSATARKLPPIPQSIDQPSKESSDEHGETISTKSINYMSNTLPCQWPSESTWDERYTRNFSDISITSEFDDSKPEVPPKPNRLQNQDTYLEPTYLTK
ncbi:protocadherin beta-15-like [Octopus sinensis]|uniref:Protocadherin beta-15-like n=1 Tax=Octopus sinensis TaxID=2607531 RepID=A0A7E6FCC2_9MOLL|nr:protocadherin beta-15-like [Octopus sinensis]